MISVMNIDEINKLDDESVQGEEAFQRFDALVGKVMSVPMSEIKERAAKHKDTVHLRGKKRGPKPKADASRDPASGAPA